jgi:hypothetical protein
MFFVPLSRGRPWFKKKVIEMAVEHVETPPGFWDVELPT